MPDVLLPERINDIATAMRIGLASDNLALAEEAVFGLWTWLRYSLAEVPTVPAPPGDLLREISPLGGRGFSTGR